MPVVAVRAHVPVMGGDPLGYLRYILIVPIPRVTGGGIRRRGHLRGIVLELV